VQVYGNDYDTPDGTCIRDYVHVADLCDAHLRALDYLAGNIGHHVFNLGTGAGNSVAEVLTACRKLCNEALVAEIAPRREGDPPVLHASNLKAERSFNWIPEKTLMDCIETASAWHRDTHPSTSKQSSIAAKPESKPIPVRFRGRARD
jgi:UDP-glucose 4-epimerase